MLDPRAVSEDPANVRAHLVRRGADEATLAMPDQVASLTSRRSALLQESEACRATRNQLSPQIGQLMKAGQRDEAEGLKAQVRDASARAKEIEVEIKAVEVLVAKNGVDGVYSADPRKDPSATKYDHITFDEAISKGLAVVDQTAFTLCAENELPMVVFGMEPEGNIPRVLKGERIGTLVDAG